MGWRREITWKNFGQTIKISHDQETGILIISSTNCGVTYETATSVQEFCKSLGITAADLES